MHAHNFFTYFHGMKKIPLKYFLALLITEIDMRANAHAF